MSGWSPPSPPRGLVVGLAAAFVLILAYAVLVQGSILLGLISGVLLAFVYLGWRIMATLEAIADGVHRVAEQNEREP